MEGTELENVEEPCRRECYKERKAKEGCSGLRKDIPDNI